MRIEIDPKTISPDELLYKITEKVKKLNTDEEFLCNDFYEVFSVNTHSTSRFNKIKVNIKYKILKPCFVFLYKFQPELAILIRDAAYKIVRKVIY